MFFYVVKIQYTCHCLVNNKLWRKLYSFMKEKLRSLYCYCIVCLFNYNCANIHTIEAPVMFVFNLTEGSRRQHCCLLWSLSCCYSTLILDNKYLLLSPRLPTISTKHSTNTVPNTKKWKFQRANKILSKSSEVVGSKLS